MMQMDDLYSTQDFLRSEQQKLLALLKDPDATWPSPKPSSPPSEKTSPSQTSPTFGTPEKRDISKRVKKETIYHEGCKEQEPNRNFTATPIPRGILKGEHDK